MTEQSTGKGRPTPKRSEAQRRRGPVAPPPTDRKEAARQLRAKQAEGRRRVREGSIRGDESALLPRDRGPVRRAVRELVDSRRTLGWILLPLAAIVLVSTFIPSERVRADIFLVWLAGVLAAAVEGTFTGVAVSRMLKERFPEEPRWKGHVRYAVMRGLTMRRLRVPRPQV